MSFILLKWRGMGLGGLFLASLMTMGVCSGIEGALEEIRDENSGRLAVISPERSSPPLLGGALVSTLFWGPYLHVDFHSLAGLSEAGEASLPSRLKQWAEQKCGAEKITKISIDVPTNDPEAPLLTALLERATFKRRAYLYTLSAEEFRTRFGALEGGNRQEIHAVTMEDSSRMAKTQELFIQFNKTMTVPGLFWASARETLGQGGKIFIHEDPETTAVDGVIAYGCFRDKENRKSIVIDSLFVAEAARGRGLAKTMALAAINQAFEEGVQALYWETGLGRQEAQNLYEQRFQIPSYGVAFRYQPPLMTSVLNFGGDVLKECIIS